MGPNIHLKTCTDVQYMCVCYVGGGWLSGHTRMQWCEWWGGCGTWAALWTGISEACRNEPVHCFCEGINARLYVYLEGNWFFESFHKVRLTWISLNKKKIKNSLLLLFLFKQFWRNCLGLFKYFMVFNLYAGVNCGYSGRVFWTTWTTWPHSRSDDSSTCSAAWHLDRSSTEDTSRWETHCILTI